MKNIKNKTKYDNYEMQDEYDFTDGIRVRLDNDILIFLKKQASEKKIAYQTLINNLLREYMQKEGLK